MEPVLPGHPSGPLGVFAGQSVPPMLSQSVPRRRPPPGLPRDTGQPTSRPHAPWVWGEEYHAGPPGTCVHVWDRREGRQDRGGAPAGGAPGTPSSTQGPGGGHVAGGEGAQGPPAWGMPHGPPRVVSGGSQMPTPSSPVPASLPRSCMPAGPALPAAAAGAPRAPRTPHAVSLANKDPAEDKLRQHQRRLPCLSVGPRVPASCLARRRLTQWFDTAPSRTCPQCRIQVGKRHIINKLFFDVALEEQTAPDAETLQNELDKVKAQLSMKEKEKRECQAVVDGLRDTLDVRNATIESLQKVLGETEMLCSSLKKQMKFLEQQQEDNRSSKEEARRLRNKLRSMERIELLLQSQRPEVEEMIREMGVGQAAVEQLAIYCVSLKKEYENLKEARKISSEMTEKLKKELFSVNNKSLKKKIDILQDTLKVPSVTRETLSRLVFESPTPVELRHPKLHCPVHSDEINLDATFDVDTPEHQPCRSLFNPTKRQKLDKKPPPVVNLAKKVLKETVENWADDLEADALKGLLPTYIRNSVLAKKPSSGSLLGPHKNTGTVRMGYDGLGGRTKFIQPTNLSEIRPLAVRSKKKNVSRPASAAPSASSSSSSQARLDSFLQ
ncbi:E3 ubiquitin-protein ligase TRAIP isoform X2 [Chroicocephalus ridibundus]|uniref:E3 ubiquitin-protein ligase TRAIP isoform X2 n=1 Tax=Chroicocephalus ridibundus TaxID=1192867 RepID=UPI002FDEA2CF